MFVLGVAEGFGYLSVRNRKMCDVSTKMNSMGVFIAMRVETFQW